MSCTSTGSQAEPRGAQLLRHDLDYSPETWVAIGTLALGFVTLLLAVTTALQVRLSRRALEGSERPLLVDIPMAATASPMLFQTRRGSSRSRSTFGTAAPGSP